MPIAFEGLQFNVMRIYFLSLINSNDLKKNKIFILLKGIKITSPIQREP